MKLIFSRDEEQVTSVHLVTDEDGERRPFTYSEMINRLLQSEQLEAPGIDGNFSDQEVSSIKTMVAEINEAAHGTDSPGADEVQQEPGDIEEIPF